jgi:hypothetical protein
LLVITAKSLYFFGSTSCMLCTTGVRSGQCFSFPLICGTRLMPSNFAAGKEIPHRSASVRHQIKMCGKPGDIVRPFNTAGRIAINP